MKEKDKTKKYILWFKDINAKDTPLVGGKNASLGEMYSKLSSEGIRVPNGFALTSKAFWYFLDFNNITQKLKTIFSKKFNAHNLKHLQRVSREIQNLIISGKFPEDLEKEILSHYKVLSEFYGQKYTDVAVRSSGTAEDLASASFAGEHETYLNVRGRENLLLSIKKCIGSMFTERAIAYREEKGFSHLSVALSVGIQKMVRSDLASSGVMFTLDTETGFPNVVLINAIWGVGEMIVKGKVTPDEFYVFKPTLKKGYKSIIIKNLGRKTKKYVYGARGGLVEKKVSQKMISQFALEDEEIITLAKWAMKIENHYGVPQDIEWAKDGITNELFVVQSRPETVHSTEKRRYFKEYTIEAKGKEPILEGIAVGNKVGSGKVRVISDVSKISEFKKGEVLVTRMTDPDWVPAMRIASAIITDEGGKTCHAAIVARELGVPAVVGTANATKVLKNSQTVTVDCTQGLNGRVYDGQVKIKERVYDLVKIKKPKVKLMVNIASPEMAFGYSFLPVDGVGLAREEFIIAEKIKVHPLALYYYDKLKDYVSKSKSISESSKMPLVKPVGKSEIKSLLKKIDEITIEHKNKKEYFIKELAEGIAQISAAFWPKEVIVRFSDFKTNEYRQLIGGELFEPEEDNPMLGWRGASRYYDKDFKEAFLMECQAIKRVREVFGLKNVSVMVPFCRTREEGLKVMQLIKRAGLRDGKNGVKVYVMAEIPSNILLADEFLDIFDGFSIGSNDLTQLTLGIDRDNARLQKISDERNEAVKILIRQVIKKSISRGKYCGICGQAPSDFPEFAQFLIDEGIESISLNPDTVIPFLLKMK